MACDIPEPCMFPSVDCCQKRFLWTHKEVGLAQRPVVCAVGRDVFNVPTSIPCVLAMLLHESVGESLSSLRLPLIRSMSSANRRLRMGLKTTEIDV